MQKRRRELPKLAKIAIVAMLLADGAGIYLAHNKLNRAPTELTAGVSEDFVLAKPVTLTPVAPPAALQPGPVALAAALPLERPAQAYPGILDLRPIQPELTSAIIERASEVRVAEAAPTLPSVRLSAARPAKRQSRAFNSAFAHDLATPSQSIGFLPDISLAKLPVESDTVLPAGAASNPGQMDAVPAASDPVGSAVIEAPATPAADAAASADAPSTAPVSASSNEGELPPS
jgi:hypothetical protein